MKRNSAFSIPYLPVPESAEDNREQLSLRAGVAAETTSQHDTRDVGHKQEALSLMEDRGHEAKVKGADPQRTRSSIDAESVSTTEWHVWGDDGWRDGWS